MKIKEFKDLRSKKAEDLVKMISEKKVLRSKKYMEIKAGKEKNLKSVLNLRREIAKILTLVREKEILEKIENDKKRKEVKS